MINDTNETKLLYALSLFSTGKKRDNKRNKNKNKDKNENIDKDKDENKNRNKNRIITEMGIRKCQRKKQK